MSAKPDLEFCVSDKNEGFNVLESEANPDIIVRELIQNAHDASVEAKRKTAEITFRREEIPVAAIPGMDSYRDALKASIKRPQQLGEEQQEWPIIKLIESKITKSKINVLWITDNGVGLSTEKMRKLLALGNSQKKGASGSVGVGHMTAFPASDIRYIVYGGCSKKEKIVSGHAILRSHKQGKMPKGPSSYFRLPKSEGEENDSFPESRKAGKIWDAKIEEIQSMHGTGSFVCILGFNCFKSPEEDLEESIFYTAATHFMPLIFDKKLAVNYGSERLDHSNMEAFIEKRKGKHLLDNTRIKISGAKFFDLYRNLKRNRAMPVPVKLTRHSGETINILLEQSSDVTSTSVHLFRNGMSITNEVPLNRTYTYSDYAPFNAMILLDNESAETANQLITRAETPTHSTISYKNNSVINNDEKKNIEEIFKEIQGAIKAEAKPYSDEESFWSPYITIDGKNKGKPQQRKPIRQRGEPDPEEPGPGPGPGPGPARYRRGVPANIKSCFEIIDNNKIKVHANALENFGSQDVEVSLVRKSGSDNSCDSPDPDTCVEIVPSSTKGNRLLNRDCHVPLLAGEDQEFVAVRLSGLKKGKFDLEIELTRAPPPLGA